jgi:hypothetical protein
MHLTELRLAELWDLARSKAAHQAEFSYDSLTADERMVLEQYLSIDGSMSQSWQSAPQKAVELVKAIMPPSERRFLIARLVHPRPLLGFARGLVSQVQFQSDEVQVRMQLEEIPSGWRMWGRTSESGWAVWSGTSNVLCNEDGEFELDVRTRSIEPLSLQNESTTILLPMIVEETGDGNA